MRRDVPRLLVVGADRRHGPSSDVIQAHDRQRRVEDVAQRGVLLHLRRREQDSVDAALHHRRQRVLGPGTFRLDAGEKEPVALPAGFLLRPGERAAQARVAEVSGDEPDSPRPLHDQAARLEVGDVTEIARRLEDPRPRGVRDGTAAVQHLARGLEADAGTRGDVLDGDVPGGPAHPHAAVIMPGKRTFAQPSIRWR